MDETRRSKRKKRRRREKKRSLLERLDMIDYHLSRLELKQAREAFRLSKKRRADYIV